MQCYDQCPSAYKPARWIRVADPSAELATPGSESLSDRAAFNALRPISGDPMLIKQRSHALLQLTHSLKVLIPPRVGEKLTHVVEVVNEYVPEGVP